MGKPENEDEDDNENEGQEPGNFTELTDWVDKRIGGKLKEFADTLKGSNDDGGDDDGERSGDGDVATGSNGKSRPTKETGAPAGAGTGGGWLNKFLYG